MSENMSMGLKDNFKDPVPGHYEEKFEFRLWKMIREHADAKDISYSKAAAEVVHDYSKTTRCRDVAFADAVIHAREHEGIAEVQDSNRSLNKSNVRE